jgi:hypothetical protein
MSLKRRLNDTNLDNCVIQRKIYPTVISSVIKLREVGLGLNPGVCNDSLALTHLRHRTVADH